MSGWARFTETFFNGKVMLRYLPDILWGVVVTIELALLVVVTGIAGVWRSRCSEASASDR